MRPWRNRLGASARSVARCGAVVSPGRRPLLPCLMVPSSLLGAVAAGPVRISGVAAGKVTDDPHQRAVLGLVQLLAEAQPVPGEEVADLLERLLAEVVDGEHLLLAPLHQVL